MVDFTTNKGIPKPTVAGDKNQWGTFLNQGMTIIDNALGATSTVAVGGSVNVTATASDAQNLAQVLTGTLTGDVSYLLPAVGGFFDVMNSTAGDFNLSVKTVAGGSVGPVVRKGASTLVRSNGTDVFEMTTDPGGYGALAIRTTDQSIPSGVSTAIIWSSASYDDLSIWSGGAPTRLTVPKGYTRVRLTGNVQWFSNATSIRNVAIRKNGADGYGYGEVRDSSPAAGVYQNLSSALLVVTPGDYFELFVRQITGSNLDIIGAGVTSTWFGMELIR